MPPVPALDDPPLVLESGPVLSAQPPPEPPGPPVMCPDSLPPFGGPAPYPPPGAVTGVPLFTPPLFQVDAEPALPFPGGELVTPPAPPAPTTTGYVPADTGKVVHCI